MSAYEKWQPPQETSPDTVPPQIGLGIQVLWFFHKHSPLFFLPLRIRWIGWATVFMALYIFFNEVFWSTVLILGVLFLASCLIVGLTTFARNLMRRTPKGERLTSEERWSEFQ